VFNFFLIIILPPTSSSDDLVDLIEKVYSNKTERIPPPAAPHQWTRGWINGLSGYGYPIKREY